MKIEHAVPGHAPPIDEYVVKIASRCNINCSYCYEYNKGDDSWKDQPKRMSSDTVRQLAERIAEHSNAHGLSAVAISMHGGEPLLVGPSRLGEFCSVLRAILEDRAIEAHISVQTNGVLISPEFVEIFREHRVSVGVSLDGGERHNDRHRLGMNGESTFHAAKRGIELMVEQLPDQFQGLLAVIDPRNGPLEVVDELYETGARNIDLLLPHHNWDAPPLRLSEHGMDYGDWYLDVFSSWVAGHWPGLRIRFLENLVRRLTGHPGIMEDMSLVAPSLVTISTSGGIEGVDTLKSTGSGLQDTRLDIWSSSFEDVLSHPIYQDRCSPSDQLCGTCRRCEMADVCVGGYLPHRYSSRSGFDNPSIYCSDLFGLIEGVSSGLRNVSKPR